ncbi:MAG: MerR family transcriptional regulator [Clostridium sp.]
MDQSYKIKELSALYGLCTDTLRYYEEQGILTPRRSANNYRMFGVQDIGTLNIVRSLRDLDIPIERIREYIHNRTIETTLNLLDEEEDLILQKMKQLKEQYDDISGRKRELLTDKQTKDGAFSIRICEARPCFQLMEDVILENNIDFVLKKLEHKFENNIHVIGIKGFGALMKQSYVAQGDYNHFQSVFFISDWDNHNSEIAEGEYASLFFRGEYERIAEVFPKFVNRIANKGYQISGTPMELYHIDMYDTCITDEYLTEIQVKVKQSTTQTHKTGNQGH